MYVKSSTNPGSAGINAWDAWGGVGRNSPLDWVQVTPGVWAISGSSESRQNEGYGGAMSVGDYNNWARSRIGSHDPNSPHFNAAIAAQWLKLHPGANTPPAEGQKEGDYNPDIWRLVNGSAPGVAGTGGLGAQATNNSPVDVGKVGMAANPISLNPNGMDLAGALNLFKQYNANKSQVNIGNASKYYNPVQFHGFSLI